MIPLENATMTLPLTDVGRTMSMKLACVPLPSADSVSFLSISLPEPRIASRIRDGLTRSTTSHVERAFTPRAPMDKRSVQPNVHQPAGFERDKCTVDQRKVRGVGEEVENRLRRPRDLDVVTYLQVSHPGRCSCACAARPGAAVANRPRTSRSAPVPCSGRCASPRGTRRARSARARARCPTA